MGHAGDLGHRGVEGRVVSTTDRSIQAGVGDQMYGFSGCVFAVRDGCILGQLCDAELWRLLDRVADRQRGLCSPMLNTCLLHQDLDHIGIPMSEALVFYFVSCFVASPDLTQVLGASLARRLSTHGSGEGRSISCSAVCT